MKLGTRKLNKRSNKDINALERIKLTMAGCFDFRVRSTSFDMHQLETQHKLAKISKLFRSRSEPNVKGSPGASPLVSPKGSPRGSPGKDSPGSAPRRRFMRVVRDSEKKGEEYENPHVVRKYTQQYVSVLQKSLSLDERPLPYTVSGNTILKKYNSIEGNKDGGLCNNSSPPMAEKHTSFKEEVDVIEYDKKGKIPSCKLVTHKEKLHDDSDDDFYVSDSGDDTSDSFALPPSPLTDPAGTCLDSDSDSTDNQLSDSTELEQPNKKSKIVVHQVTCTQLRSSLVSEVTDSGRVDVILEEDAEALEDLHLPLMRDEP